jgi:frataxin-like iron-binding protein CyaY
MREFHSFAIGTDRAWDDNNNNNFFSSYQRMISTTSHRNYHGTVVTSLAAVRRRKRTGRGGPNSPEPREEELERSFNLEKIEDIQVFHEQVEDILTKIDTALQPLLPINPDMQISRGFGNPYDFLVSDDTAAEVDESKKSSEYDDQGSLVQGKYIHIDLGPVEGSYSFIADEMEQQIVYQSPISGRRMYYLAKTGEWVDMYDNHHLIGIFVRDLIKQIQGVPKL